MKKLLIGLLGLLLTASAFGLESGSIAMHHEVTIGKNHPHNRFVELCWVHSSGCQVEGLLTDHPISKPSHPIIFGVDSNKRLVGSDEERGSTGNFTLRNLTGPPKCRLSAEILYYSCWGYIPPK